jgi:uncharacterized repeat protein (TIGR03809 family)
MLSLIPCAVSASTSRKGLMLAESRRAHLIELYKTGRWKRYFSEDEFLARMREAVREVETWTALAALWDNHAPNGAAGSPARIAAQEIRIEPPHDRSADEATHELADLPAPFVTAAGDQSVALRESLS